MIEKTETTHSVDLFIAGDLQQAKQVIREFCYRVGLCVHLHPVDFVYTGGEESGLKVGFVNYPRFPATIRELEALAESMAALLLERLCQHSVLLVGSDGRTKWLSRRPENQLNAPNNAPVRCKSDTVKS